MFICKFVLAKDLWGLIEQVSETGQPGQRRDGRGGVEFLCLSMFLFPV
jgi:hypothetical protein